jgi:AcrR family transcriptional regulator
MNDEINKILDTVTEMYFKYGIKSVTMDDVSRELGISKKTLYTYFTDKADLVNKAVDRTIEKITQKYEAVIAGNLNAVEEILEFNRLAAEMIKTHNASTDYDLKKYYPELLDKIDRTKREKMYHMVLNNLKKGKAQGLFRKNLNEEIIAKLHVSRMMTMGMNACFTHDELLSVEVFREIYIYHIHGIANAKGLEILEKNLKNQKINV